MAENIKYLLSCLGGCWITTYINFPAIDQSDPFSQLHTNEVINDYCQFKGIQTYPFKVLFLQKVFLKSLGSLLNNVVLEKFSLKWWLHIIETYLKMNLKMR
jgi:hypothetical protein